MSRGNLLIVSVPQTIPFLKMGCQTFKQRIIYGLAVVNRKIILLTIDLIHPCREIYIYMVLSNDFKNQMLCKDAQICQLHVAVTSNVLWLSWNWWMLLALASRKLFCNFHLANPILGQYQWVLSSVSMKSKLLLPYYVKSKLLLP